MKPQNSILPTARLPRMRWPTVCGLRSVVFLPVFSFLLSAFCFTAVPGYAQAPGYSREEIAERAQMAPEGIMAEARPSVVGSDMLMSGERSIGSARSQVRGGRDGQSAMLRYDQHRDVTPPQYATVRIGPLYSDLGISQSVGYRYISMSGSGVDFLTGNRRGRFLKDGSDFPLVSTLSMNNYLLISRRMDLEANIKVSYEHFPLKTQEDDLRIDLTDEGVYGTFSSEYQPTRDTRILLYDDILYRTDYVDTRGYSDEYGGAEYEHFQNTVGADWDWKPSPFDNVSISAARSDIIPFDDDFALQERVEYSEAASYQRQLTPFALAGLLGAFRQSLYEDDARADVYMYNLSTFTAAQLTRRLTGSGSLGYQFSTYEGGDFGESSGRGSLSGSLGLGHQISEERSQRITYTRTQSEAFTGGIDISDSLSYGLSWSGGLLPGELTATFSSLDPQEDNRNGYSDWSVGVALRHQLTRLLQLSFSTRYAVRMNDPVAEDAEVDPNTPDLYSDYETLAIRLGAVMPVTKKTSFNAYAEHADRMSDNEDLAYTRDVIAATLTWTHKF